MSLILIQAFMCFFRQPGTGNLYRKDKKVALERDDQRI